jgi:hypothetical protein
MLADRLDFVGTYKFVLITEFAQQSDWVGVMHPDCFV